MGVARVGPQQLPLGVQTSSLGGIWPRHAAPTLMQSMRAFCTADLSLEDRVIKAVKKYAAMRKDELKNSTEDSGEELEKSIKALEQDVSTTTKWDDLGFDELDKVEVLLEVEDEFSHIIPDDEAD